MYNKQQIISSCAPLERSRRAKQRKRATHLDLLLQLGLLVGLVGLLLEQANALSLISEKCDPNKVGPDETTVKGGWQAEMFNGLSFRTCGKCTFFSLPFGRPPARLPGRPATSGSQPDLPKADKRPLVSA